MLCRPYKQAVRNLYRTSIHVQLKSAICPVYVQYFTEHLPDMYWTCTGHVPNIYCTTIKQRVRRNWRLIEDELEFDWIYVRDFGVSNH